MILSSVEKNVREALRWADDIQAGGTFYSAAYVNFTVRTLANALRISQLKLKGAESALKKIMKKRSR